MECADSRHVTLCDADSRGFIVVAFCSAILHHWMCKIPTEVATLTLTLVDKANKMCCIRKMANKCAETVVETFRSIVASTFFDFKTITSDNGTEFAGHEDISKITDADFYFARPYRSCDRGLNEHTNGLIRRFLPKGTDFNEISDAKIAKIEHTLNARRRASLDYRAPNHVFLENLMAA
ncbi:Transposase, IS30 family [Piscirickettsia salmonis]|nr:Transposase, IS30 family [Piscirickettsia salmonis]